MTFCRRETAKKAKRENRIPITMKTHVYIVQLNFTRTPPFLLINYLSYF